jgi:hypothetical protein
MLNLKTVPHSRLRGPGLLAAALHLFPGENSRNAIHLRLISR